MNLMRDAARSTRDICLGLKRSPKLMHAGRQLARGLVTKVPVAQNMEKA